MKTAEDAEDAEISEIMSVCHPERSEEPWFWRWSNNQQRFRPTANDRRLTTLLLATRDFFCD